MTSATYPGAAEARIMGLAFVAAHVRFRAGSMEGAAFLDRPARGRTVRYLRAAVVTNRNGTELQAVQLEFDGVDVDIYTTPRQWSDALLPGVRSDGTIAAPDLGMVDFDVYPDRF